MDGLFRLTIIGAVVYTIIFSLLTIGHYRELQTGEIENPVTKVGMVIGVISIFVPVTGMPLLIHTLLLFVPPERVQGGIGILAVPLSFGLLILAIFVSSTLSKLAMTQKSKAGSTKK